MEIKNIYDAAIFVSSALTIKDALIEAINAKTDLRCAYLRGAYLSGADLSGKKIHSLRSFSSCIYPYEVWAVLYEDGSRSVRMGCLFKSLKEWENYPILKSNVGEFPDDGSDASLDRAAMFELAKAAALRMTVPEK